MLFSVSLYLKQVINISVQQYKLLEMSETTPLYSAYFQSISKQIYEMFFFNPIGLLAYKLQYNLEMTACLKCLPCFILHIVIFNLTNYRKTDLEPL